LQELALDRADFENLDQRRAVGVADGHGHSLSGLHLQPLPAGGLSDAAVLAARRFYWDAGWNGSSNAV
jgi:hypothetical protein